MFEHHYVWKCQPSSEVRGRRAAHDGGCGRSNIRSTKKEITLSYRPQAVPCWHCGRRPRITPMNSEYYYSREDAERVAFEDNKAFLTEHKGEHTPEYCTE